MTGREGTRRWTRGAALTLLTALGVASAQGGGLPDAAGCARLVPPQATPMTPAFTAAVRATVGAYAARAGALTARMTTGRLDAATFREITALAAETDAYLGRLLPVTGWPADPALRAGITAGFFGDPALRSCVGQAALGTAATPQERWRAATLVDSALNEVGAGQRYGTLLLRRASRLTPLPIEDEAGVDARRAAVGLPPLAQTLAEMNATPRPQPTPAGLKRPVVLNEVCRRFTSVRALNTPLTPGQVTALEERAAVLVEQDQASRSGQSGARSVTDVDAESTIWLKEVLRQRGWPSTNRSNPDLAFNAWLLAQHADARPAVQECVLDLMTQQSSTPEEATNLAYLTDRVRLANGQPQVYGTQVSFDDVQGKASPALLADPAHVNERRAGVGLEPIEEYLKQFERPRP
ncbi:MULTISPECIES: DUF6624 domain-containing protein [Deinococcus]|uniref:DUF6624 domain-containing protein n=1 Tax=Deinococcus rufus TaxID=2136097 RepID=A0ABV7Z6M5_9DEIO|nr:DUF6624 domain-containing protein [Deinococcus sp. AB2017081]WQE96219.1 DUF6624 domain-containing protein [Deinococcus sp. AB2017081]